MWESEMDELSKKETGGSVLERRWRIANDDDERKVCPEINIKSLKIHIYVRVYEFYFSAIAAQR